MNTYFLDIHGVPLITAAVNGNFKLLTNPNRQPYTGSVTVRTLCSNGDNPCDITGGCSCDCRNHMPHFSQRPTDAIQGYKNGTEYDHQTLKDALNFGDTLPSGICPSEKLFIFCLDAIIACEWHLEDGWIIDAIIEVPFAQVY